MVTSMEELLNRKTDQYIAERKKVGLLKSALSNLIEALSEEDQDGLTEFAPQMQAARAALNL